MKHIVIDARIIASSTGTYVLNLLRYLERIDKKNRYTILVPSRDLTYWQPTNKNFVMQACDIPNYSFAEQGAFKTLLDSLKADLVHFAMPQQPLKYSGKSITTVHDMTLLKTYNSDKNWLIYRMKQQVARHLFKRIACTNKAIIIPSTYTRDEYIRFSGIDPQRTHVIYEAAEKHTGKLEPYAVPYKRFLLYVGQQKDYKNIVRLAEAHQKLRETYPDLGLVLIGKIDKAAQKNKDTFRRRGYENIHFTGFLPDPQRDWLYKECAAYVFPSLMEGFGLPGLEAMAAGAPVVSSNATCLPEVYGDAALYFDPHSVDDMVYACMQALKDNDLRAMLIKHGKDQLAKYSWQRMAKQTHDLYLRVLQ